jgi:hypothetical protein
MHGRITKFHAQLGFGVIEADNGRKYRFERSDIKNAAAGLVGQNVDFILVSSRPREIFMMAGSPWAAFGAIGQI